MVFWVDRVTGHLRSGGILRQTGDLVVVGYTRGVSVTLNVADLVPVPRFFRPDADAGAAAGFNEAQH
jgi:hypothetical protein